MAKNDYSFDITEEEVKIALEKMVKDPCMITKPGFRANKELWPNQKIPFVQMHLEYLKKRPQINPEHYLSNLKLMIRKT
jgi:hypothetical protein